MNCKGMAMIVVIFVLLLLLLLLHALIGLTTTEVRIAANEQHAAQALYLAEAGNELALAYIANNPDYRGNLLNENQFSSPLSMETGNITNIWIEQEDQFLKIISEAEVYQSKKKVEYRVQVEIGGEEPDQEVIIKKIRWRYAF